MAKDQGIELMNDQKFLTLVYDKIISIDKTKTAKPTEVDLSAESANKYFKSNYFAENRELYTKKDENDNDPNHVFNSLDIKKDDKVPFVDNFLTRYVYKGMERWIFNVGRYMGFNKGNW